MRQLVALLVMGHLLGCGARVEAESKGTSESSGSSEASGSDAASDSGAAASDSGAAASDTAGGVPPEAAPMPLTGACAEKLSEAVDHGMGPICQVVTDPSGSLESGTMGAATLASGALLVQCSTSERVLMQTVIRCYDAPGSYRIAPGDLELGGARSDRPCTIKMLVGVGRARAFISCDSKTPEDRSSVFSWSGPPLGLGAFDVPIVP